MKFCVIIIAAVIVVVANGLPSDAAGATSEAKLAFRDDDHGNFIFNTGVVKGSVKKEGKAEALKPVTYISPNVPIDNNHGLLVPYRFLTPQKRYGFGSWEWPRTSKLLDDGGAELNWRKSPIGLSRFRSPIVGRPPIRSTRPSFSRPTLTWTSSSFSLVRISAASRRPGRT